MDSDDDENVREPDKPYMCRLIDRQILNLSIDEELEYLRKLHNSEENERQDIKKILKETGIMESIENSVKYDNNGDEFINDSDDYENENNMYPNEDEIEKIMKRSEDEYFVEQLLIIEEFERQEKLLKINIIESKKILIGLIKKISNIVKLNNIKNDDNVILEILNKYMDSDEDKIFLNEIEFSIFSNYLKKNYEDLYLLKKKTFISLEDYNFIKNRITIKLFF